MWRETEVHSSSKVRGPRRPEGYPRPYYLSRFFGAAAAAVGGFPLLAVLVDVSDEHPAQVPGAGTLEAGVVRLHGVVVLLSRWVRVGCARLLCGHEVPPRGPGPGVSQHPRGHSLIQRSNIIINLSLKQII